MVSVLSLCQVGELVLGFLRYYAILSADFNDNNLFANNELLFLVSLSVFS